MAWTDGSSSIQNDFKVCDFCGALNPVENHECFICTWRGNFSKDQKKVQAAIEEAKNEYGANIFTTEPIESQPTLTGFWNQFKNTIKKLLGSN